MPAQPMGKLPEGQCPTIVTVALLGRCYFTYEYAVCVNSDGLIVIDFKIN